MTTPFYTPSSASTPATKRPGTVTAGIIIVSIGVALGLILLLIAFSVVFSVPPGAARDAVSIPLFVTTGVIIGNGVGIVLVILGYGWARFLLVATGLIGIVTALASGSGVGAGDFLYIVAVVLLFLPKSNDYFAARATARRAATSSAA